MPLESLEIDSVDFNKVIDTEFLRGKCAIITGGSGGLGLGIATALAENGAYVTIADIDDEAGTTAAKKLTLKGHHVKFIHTDVTSWSSQIAAFKAAIAHSPHATLDIVIPCAGWTGSSVLSTAGLTTANLGEDPPEPPKKTIEINITGVIYSTNLAFYYFKATRDLDADVAKEKKHLLLMGSLAGYGDHPLVGDYTASKWAVRGLWKSIRGHSALLGGVRMNLLAPTWIDAGIGKEKVEQLEAQGIEPGAVEDVVAAALRCCCDETIEGRAIAIAPSQEGKPHGSSNFDLDDDAVHGEGNPALLRSFARGVFGEGAPALVGLTKDDIVQLLSDETEEGEQKSKNSDDGANPKDKEHERADNGEARADGTKGKQDEDSQIQDTSSHTASSHPPLTSGQEKARRLGEFDHGIHGEGYGKSEEGQSKSKDTVQDRDVPLHGEETIQLEMIGAGLDDQASKDKKAQDDDEDQVDHTESTEGVEAQEKMADQEEKNEEKEGGQGGGATVQPHKEEKGSGKHASEDDESDQASKKRKGNDKNEQ